MRSACSRTRRFESLRRPSSSAFSTSHCAEIVRFWAEVIKGGIDVKTVFSDLNFLLENELSGLETAYMLCFMLENELHCL